MGLCMRAPRRRVWRLTRSGEINDNPVILKQRAEVFASGATAAGPSTLVVTRDAEGLRHYAIMPATSRIDSAALSLAHCVAARLNPLDEAPDLSFGPVVGHLRWRRTHASIRATQAGADIAEVSRILGDVMPDGSWVGAVIRRPGMFERRRWLNWLSYRMGTRRPTHHSTSEDAVVTTIWAGSSSKDDTRAVLESLAAGLPGFDLGTKVAFPSRWRWTILASLAAAMMVAPWIIGLLPWWLSLPPAAGTLSLGVLAGARLLPTRDARVQRGLGTSRLLAPRRRTIPPRRPKRIHTEHIDTEAHFEGGSYPLRREALILGPELPASMVAPHSGALSGASTTRERQVPLAMTRPIGPMIGTTNDGQKVFLSARDSAAGIACVGRPGSGKSVLLSNVFTWSMMERVNPSGMPGSPGRNNTLVNFETKLDGARTTLQWAHAVGDRVLLIEVANPASHAIDLFAVPGSVEERALHFTNALQYAFADGSIRDESFRTLKVVLTGGLVVDDDMVADIEGVAAGRSPIYYASVLMGRLGDEAGKQLATAIHAEHEKAQAAGHIASDYSVAWESLALLYGPTVTPSQRAGFQRAPGNKLDQLLALEHYFAPARKKVTWSQILTGHRAVVILTGVDSAGHIMESNMEQLMSSLLMFSLCYNIERTCSGWEDQDRWVSIFADELKELAGSTPDIITWLRNKGRSYGVRPHFATQYPEQLNMDVRDALLSFSTLIAFTQGTPRIARELVEDFAGDGTDWTVGDVLDLPPYHAIVRANVNYKRQSPFPFRSAYFLDEHTKQPLVEQFRAAQEPSA